MSNGDGSLSDFTTTIEKNCLYIKNIKEQKARWIKLGITSRDKNVVFSDTTNEEGNFRPFKFDNKNIDKFNWKKMLQELKLNENNKVRVELFGPSSNKTDIIEF